MKTPNMISKIVGFVILASALVLTACPGNNNQTASPRGRTMNPGQGPLVNPVTGQTSGRGAWGVITSTDGNQFSSTLLNDFMWATGIGPVSGNAQDGSNTGILFSGGIIQMSGSGTIEILVKDTQAIQTGAAYDRLMNVIEVNGSGSGASVTAQDATGTVNFNGTFSGQMWQGTVQYQNNSSAGNGGGTVGNFQIPACSIFQC